METQLLRGWGRGCALEELTIFEPVQIQKTQLALRLLFHAHLRGPLNPFPEVFCTKAVKEQLYIGFEERLLRCYGRVSV